MESNAAALSTDRGSTGRQKASKTITSGAFRIFAVRVLLNPEPCGPLLIFLAGIQGRVRVSGDGVGTHELQLLKCGKRTGTRQRGARVEGSIRQLKAGEGPLPTPPRTPPRRRVHSFLYISREGPAFVVEWS